MRKIPLTRGQFALVDDEDYPILSLWKWCTAVAKSGLMYARSRDSVRYGTGRLFYMHHLLVDLKPGFEIDHIDGNGLNNQRDNLRLVTHRKNMQNRRDSLSMMGTSRTPYGWRASIEIKGKRRHLGTFTTAKEAHRAYLDAVKEVS